MVSMDYLSRELNVTYRLIARKINCVISYSVIGYVPGQALASMPSRADLQASVP
jgi:hypothetical protein